MRTAAGICAALPIVTSAPAEGHASAPAGTSGTHGASTPGARGTSTPSDFDFFIGAWRVRHRRLKERLAGSTEWEDFGGTTVVQKVLGGLGNVDDNVIELPAGAYRAVTLRAFDPQERLWSIWWLDGRFPQQLDTPVRGSFANGVGTFCAHDRHAGKPVVVRFIWSDITRENCRWQQAFSTDAGATWETNWVMDFQRSLDGQA